MFRKNSRSNLERSIKDETLSNVHSLDRRRI